MTKAYGWHRMLQLCLLMLCFVFYKIEGYAIPTENVTVNSSYPETCRKCSTSETVMFEWCNGPIYEDFETFYENVTYAVNITVLEFHNVTMEVNLIKVISVNYTYEVNETVMEEIMYVSDSTTPGLDTNVSTIRPNIDFTVGDTAKPTEAGATKVIVGTTVRERTRMLETTTKGDSATTQAAVVTPPIVTVSQENVTHRTETHVYFRIVNETGIREENFTYTVNETVVQGVNITYTMNVTEPMPFNNTWAINQTGWMHFNFTGMYLMTEIEFLYSVSEITENAATPFPFNITYSIDGEEWKTLHIDDMVRWLVLTMYDAGNMLYSSDSHKQNGLLNMPLWVSTY